MGLLAVCVATFMYTTKPINMLLAWRQQQQAKKGDAGADGEGVKVSMMTRE